MPDYPELGERGPDTPLRLVIVEPSSSMGVLVRREDVTGLIDREGVDPGTDLLRVVGFTPHQLVQSHTLPWRASRSVTAPSLRLFPIVRVGPAPIAWPLLMAQVAVLGLSWRAIGRTGVAFALSPQAGALAVLLKFVASHPFVCRLQTDLPRSSGKTLRRALIGLVLRSADGVIAISAFTASVAREVAVPPERISVLPPAVDPRFLDPPTPRRRGPSFTVTFIGRLEPEKGPIDALEAFARSHSRHWNLIIVGAGSLKGDLCQRVQMLGLDDRVEFRGRVSPPDVVGVLDEAACIVIPTRVNEGYGRVAIEALLRQVPVVGYRSGGLGEAVGPGGILVPTGDVEALASALAKLSRDTKERARLAIAGYEHALEQTRRTHVPLTELARRWA